MHRLRWRVTLALMGAVALLIVQLAGCSLLLPKSPVGVRGYAVLEDQGGTAGIRIEVAYFDSAAHEFVQVGTGTTEADGEFAVFFETVADETTYRVSATYPGYSTDSDTLFGVNHGDSSQLLEVNDLMLATQKRVIVEWVFEPSGSKTFPWAAASKMSTLLTEVENGVGDNDSLMFESGQTTAFGELSVSMQGLSPRLGSNYACRMIDLGPVSLESVRQVPDLDDPNWSDRSLAAITGHTYCYWTTEMTFAKVFIREIAEGP